MNINGRHMEGRIFFARSFLYLARSHHPSAGPSFSFCLTSNSYPHSFFLYFVMRIDALLPRQSDNCITCPDPPPCSCAANQDCFQINRFEVFLLTEFLFINALSTEIAILVAPSNVLRRTAPAPALVRAVLARELWLVLLLVR